MGGSAAASRTSKGRKRGPGGGLLPILPAHNARSDDQWPESAPQDGPELGDPRVDRARDVLGLPILGTLPDGASTSLGGGCDAKTGNPLMCFGQSAGENGRDRKDGKSGKKKPTGDGAPSKANRKPTKPKSKFGPYAGTDVTGKTTVTRGDPELRSDGHEYQGLDVDAEIETKTSAGLDLKLFGTGVSRSDKRKIAYQTSVRKDRAERIAKGEEAPDPYHPKGLEKGESITLGDTRSKTTGGGHKLGPGRLAGDEEKGTTESAGVQRVGKDKVRISVGSEEFVRGSQKAGLGTDGYSVSLGSGGESREGKKSEIDLDLSTAAGRKAYDRFVDKGELPAPNAKGSRDATLEKSRSWSEDHGTSGEAGPSSLSQSDSDHAESHKDKENLDKGDEGREVKDEHKWGDTNLEQVARTRPDGSRAPDTTEISVQGADGDAVKEALELRGVAKVPEIDDEADVRVDFSEEELERLKGDVIEGLKDEHDSDLPPEQYSARKRQVLPDYDEPRRTMGATSYDPKEFIAAAETPADVGREVQLIGDEEMNTAEGHHFVEELNKLSKDSKVSPSGQITVFNEDGTKYIASREFCGRLKKIASDN